MQDRVALVTGASSGIGACIAQCLLERGWRVYGTSRHPLEQVGGGIRWIQLDITDEKAIRNASGMLAATEGRLDALVNNAGMGIAGPLELLAPEEMALQMDTNFSGTLRLTQTMLPLMKEGGHYPHPLPGAVQCQQGSPGGCHGGMGYRACSTGDPHLLPAAWRYAYGLYPSSPLCRGRRQGYPVWGEDAPERCPYGERRRERHGSPTRGSLCRQAP